jgi:hypothetical protein
VSPSPLSMAARSPVCACAMPTRPSKHTIGRGDKTMRKKNLRRMGSAIVIIAALMFFGAGMFATLDYYNHVKACGCGVVVPAVEWGC